MLSSVAVESTAASLVKSACTNPDTPSNKFNSVAVEVRATPPSVKEPPTVRLPDKSKAPFMSMVVAAICISVSATRSSCPSVLELM